MRSLLLLLAMASLSLGEAATPHIKGALAAYEAGRTAQHENQFQRASDSFRKAIEIEPTFLDAREALITVYLDSGQRLEAAAWITQFLEIKPDAIHYRILLGQILLEQKQSERALAQFSFALKKDPYNVDGLLGFASAAREMGMEDRAAAAVERGKKHYPYDERFKGAPPSRSQ